MNSPTDHAPIGVFDSGIGGLSILRALRDQLPSEDFVYFADTAHNPYGEKSDAFVTERSLAIADELVREHRIKALVVACNTATAAAIHVLRAAYPNLPIVGVEPALKPAAEITRTGRVAVLATQGTLQSAKFAALKESLAGRAEFVCVAAQGLAEQVEALSRVASDATQFATNLIAARAHICWAKGQFDLKNHAIDTLVLGCTHYPLIRPVFADVLGAQVQIVDNALPVARQTQHVLQSNLQTVGEGKLHYLSSGDVAQLQMAADFWLSAKADVLVKQVLKA
jgi:glutamate racemase